MSFWQLETLRKFYIFWSDPEFARLLECVGAYSRYLLPTVILRMACLPYCADKDWPVTVPSRPILDIKLSLPRGRVFHYLIFLNTIPFYLVQSHSPPLPQELIDCIIDILCSDIPALRSCSLVCRSFLPRAREHLFREVDIETSHLRQSFHDLCVASPDIPHVVESLIGVTPGEEGGVPPYLILQSLPRLEKIAVSCTEWNSMGPTFWETVSNLTHLRSLKLIGTVIPSISILCSLVSSRVEELCLIDTEFVSKEVCQHDGCKTRVQSLTCSGNYRPIEYESVMSLCPALANTAHSIDVNLYDHYHILQMKEQVEKGNLRHITVLHIPRDSHIHRNLPILPIRRLRSISVQLWDHHSQPDVTAGFPDLGLLEWWIQNFEHCKNSDIQRVTFRVCYDSVYSPSDDYSVWRKLDKACAAMSSLRSLEIVVLRDSLAGMEIDIILAHGMRAIEDQLTLSKQRGIVSVSEQ
ncbi:uncharacterized protein EV420DRAFT_1481218 [Desarmillaria tabescens]|uniref:F-box domain-containing protein n=1 Tax=Armillaria tabescens TaxID=1929756 RepID=A0AA39N2Q4_ARMTA|nr:uncharacterized protein EV420DRAFT_1481218 [Desarmillaria tabescens]KAK0455777.1 hypothetical protein EV420DRAFT_1481218 [Desarmillaria tabescens]